MNQSWDETKPLATDLISSGDDEIRNLKVAIRERLDVEHVFTSGNEATVGEHAPGFITAGKGYLADDSVVTAKIADSSVTLAKFAPSALTLQPKVETTLSFNIPTLAAGAHMYPSPITVTGVAVGDFCMITPLAGTAGYLIVYANISAVDEVRVVVFNGNMSTPITLTPATFSLRVYEAA